MKAVSIIGYKGSGKTMLLESIACELTARGKTVSTVKSISSGLDLPWTDTTRHRRFACQIAALAPEGSAIFFRENKSLEEMLSYLDADYILIEGFKSEKTLPKIICLRQGDDPKTLMDGLEICIVGTSPEDKLNIDVPVLDPRSDIARISDLVEEKAFKLPGMDCGACGYKTCYELATQIINGAKTVKDCQALNPYVQVKIDNQILPMLPVVSEFIRNTITGMLSSLKGYRKGKIEINIKD